jgi:hypothetical protein
VRPCFIVFASSGRLQELLSPAPDENELNNAVTEPVCNFYPTAEGLDHAEGSKKSLAIMGESPIGEKVLRELRLRKLGAV